MKAWEEMPDAFHMTGGEVEGSCAWRIATGHNWMAQKADRIRNLRTKPES